MSRGRPHLTDPPHMGNVLLMNPYLITNQPTEFAVTIPGEWCASRGVGGTQSWADRFAYLGGLTLRVAPNWRLGLSGTDVTVIITGSQAAIEFVLDSIEYRATA